MRQKFRTLAPRLVAGRIAPTSVESRRLTERPDCIPLAIGGERGPCRLPNAAPEG